MTHKIKSSKPKAIVISAMVLAVMLLGATTAFAASALTDGGNLFKVEDGTAQYSTDGGTSWNEGTPDDGGSWKYSLDEGETWNEGLPPEGQGEKSFVVYDTGNAPDPGDAVANSFAVKNEDGKARYSFDGGKTWNEELPQGATSAADGSISFQNPNK